MGDMAGAADRNDDLDQERFEIAEAAVLAGDKENPDLELYTRNNFPNVRQARTASSILVLVYVSADHDRFVTHPDGSLATLYTGRAYDTRTLSPLGAPKRSNDPAELRSWWHKQTGAYPSSRALVASGEEG